MNPLAPERLIRTGIFAATRIVVLSLGIGICLAGGASGTVDLRSITTPMIFEGDTNTAYRDPAAIYQAGTFHLYFTLVKRGPDEKAYSYTAWSRSTNLVDWTEPCIFTPRDRSLNFSSPGNIVRFNNQWILCLQTYPRPKGEKHANSDARVWIRRSRDLEHWSEPELLRVKGPDVPQEKMGRMIDPFLLEDKDEPGKWWCFFTQGGASMSWSRDLTNWNYTGRVEAVELARKGSGSCHASRGESIGRLTLNRS